MPLPQTAVRTAFALSAALLALPALAHDGIHIAGFADGFAHPFSGADHLLAMMAVGIWAAQHKRSALWLLPLAFPLMMAAGAALGMAGMHSNLAEAGAAASVALLGLLIAFAIRMPAAAGAAIVALFALMHGYAHGTEMPRDALPLTYGAGFIAATALLHLAGLGIRLLARDGGAAKWLRGAGAAIAAAGAGLLASLM